MARFDPLRGGHPDADETPKSGVTKRPHYAVVLMEQMRDELRAVHELVADVPTRGEFNELREDVRQLQADVTIIKRAVGEHSGELARLDSRVSTLEAA